MRLKSCLRGIAKMNTRNFNAMVDQAPARRMSDVTKGRANDVACMVIILSASGVAFTLALLIAFMGEI